MTLLRPRILRCGHDIKSEDDSTSKTVVEERILLDEQTMTERGLGVSPSFLDAREGLYGRTMQAKWALRSASADTTSAGRANEMETGSARKWEANAESGPPSSPLSLPDIHLLCIHACPVRPSDCLPRRLPFGPSHRGSREGILSPSRDGDLQRSAHGRARALHVPIGPSDRRTAAGGRTDRPSKTKVR